MIFSLLPVSLLILVGGVLALATGLGASHSLGASPEPQDSALGVAREFVVIPNPTNAVRFRLHTNASRHAAHLFNTFDLEVDGDTILQSPSGDGLRRWLETSPSSVSLHNLLVNGAGPQLDSTNGMTVIEQSSGPEWSYLSLDATATYRGSLREWRRSILFVEPDVFVMHDHLVSRDPSSFEMLLHPPETTHLDGVWGDLRVESARASLIIHAPAGQKRLRPWERIESGAAGFLPGTVTMRLAPTGKLNELNLLSVFAVRRGLEKRDFAFKLLESTSAIGVRIHRDGLPTLVAFKTNPSGGDASLTGFGFTGPVGVSVFKPKKRP